MSKLKKILFLILGTVVFLGFTFVMPVWLIKISEEDEKIKDIVLEAALEDFNYIREEDEIYMYNIEELIIRNYTPETKKEVRRIFKVFIMDDNAESETYRILIVYNKRLFKIDITYIKVRSWEYE